MRKQKYIKPLVITFLVLILASFTVNLALHSNTDYATAVSWANWYEGYLPCLNSDKLSISSIRHLPILKFENLAELEQFKTDYADEFDMNQEYDEIPSFESSVSKMDKSFFEDYTVFLVYVSANSVSLRFGVNSVDIIENSLLIRGNFLIIQPLKSYPCISYSSTQTSDFNYCSCK